MKFARYLEDTQTPEWKKAYINYRFLKKRVNAVRSAVQAVRDSSSTDGEGEGEGEGEERPARGAATPAVSQPAGPGARIGLVTRPSYIWSRAPSPAPLPLSSLLPRLPPTHRAFFAVLDHELEKVDAFYAAREKEAVERGELLKTQLTELKSHRQLFHAAHAGPPSLPAQVRLRAAHALRRPGAVAADGSTVSAAHGAEGDGGTGGVRALEPDEYLHAKKKLRRAVLEYYRGLEILNNYRIMNLTGFRKALKKYEKVTGVKAQEQYIKEKVQTSGFASGATISTLMFDMEQLFAARFERGDRKRALVRLRAGARHQSHHFSVFRAGVMLGLAVPATVAGLYQSFQPATRVAIEGWDALLFMYGVLLVPTVFALLVGLNLLAWSTARINYVFIFELDVHTRLDPREYFEIPAFLLATLSYAFFLSFVRAAAPAVPPAAWPAVWLAGATLFVVDPLPWWKRTARWWALRSVGRLAVSGAHHVEFTDFWLGDQLCSLVFTLSNLYFFFCATARARTELGGAWEACAHPRAWGVPFVIAALPFFARLVQSVRRWRDSALATHLINGGKYACGIVYYLFYFLWRYEGAPHEGSSFVLFCLLGTIYAAYASAWDILMDWSLLRPHAKFMLLRNELVYTDQIPLYYFAMISNVMIRFAWVLYVPSGGASFPLRTFVAAMLEMSRRVQWNFFRLENEHIGNMDQYRATREVPLPYQLDDPLRERVEDEDRDEDAQEARSIRSARRARGQSRKKDADRRRGPPEAVRNVQGNENAGGNDSGDVSERVEEGEAREVSSVPPMGDSAHTESVGGRTSASDVTFLRSGELDSRRSASFRRQRRPHELELEGA